MKCKHNLGIHATQPCGGVWGPPPAEAEAACSLGTPSMGGQSWQPETAHITAGFPGVQLDFNGTFHRRAAGYCNFGMTLNLRMGKG